MKNKILIFLTIIFSFILTDKVSAKTYDTDIIEKLKEYSYNQYLKIHPNKNIYNTVILYNNTDNKYYVPIKSSIYNIDTFETSAWSINYYQSHHILVSPNWWILNGLVYYDKEKNIFSTMSTNYQWYTGNTSSVIMDSPYFDFEIVYSDKPIKVKTSEPFVYKGVTYNYGDVFYQNKIEPTININIETSKVNDDNEPIQKKIIVDYGIYDFDNYKYEYSSYGISDKNSSDGLFWLPYLNSTPFEFYVNNNDTYFFRVTDKNTGDYVTSSSITVAGIVENLPYIVFENLKDDECVLNYYNDFYFTCDLVKLYAKNIDYSKYSLQYSYDKTNWVNHNNYYSSEIYIRDNTTLYARIIDLITNDIVDTLSYTVTHLTFPNSNLPIIKITTDCVDNVVGASIKVNLYNYDIDKYKLFYKVYDNTEFLETNVVVDGNNFYKYFTLSKETVLYIKIVDVDNNYITGTSFTYTGNLCKKDNLDINNIDDINDLILDKDSSSNQLFSQILNICYTSAPRRLVIFLKLFLILTLIGAVLYLVGWK